MEENKNQELNNQNDVNETQEATTGNGGSPAPASQKEVEEVAVIEVPVWVGKIIGGAKKVAKFVIPVATAAVGAFVGIKVGTNKEARRSKAETDALNGTIDSLRNQLESKPLELPELDNVTDVPAAFSEVVDTISE